MKKKLLICLSLMCLSSMAITSEEKSSKQYQTFYNFSLLDINASNKDHYTMAQKLSCVIANQSKLDPIRVLSKNSDIELFMNNVNLILELEDFIKKNKHSIGRSNQAQILGLTQLLKQSYLDKLENSKQF